MRGVIKDMVMWKDPKWFDNRSRKEQLDEHIQNTKTARFGLKVYNEKEKKYAVVTHFNRVAEKYDFMNSLLSFGIQRVWKRAAVSMLNLKTGDSVLDVCGGTGDLSILASKKVGPDGKVMLFDMNRAMMKAGISSESDKVHRKAIHYIQGDAEYISLEDGQFDAAMVGFGIRNVTHLKQGFSEMYRVLKPGGRILCLEFSKPYPSIFRWLYDFYSFNIMPYLGQLIVGSAESYACLPETIRMFPLPDELSGILERIGFEKVHYKSMTNGIAVAHVGTKPL